MPTLGRKVQAVKGSEADAAVEAIEAFEAGAVVERRDLRDNQSVMTADAFKRSG